MLSPSRACALDKSGGPSSEPLRFGKNPSALDRSTISFSSAESFQHQLHLFTPTSHFACTSPPSQQRSPHPHAYSVRAREKREHSSLSLCSRASPRVYMCALGKFIPYYCCAFSFFTCMLPLLWNRAVASLFFSPRADAPSLVPQKAPRKARARNFCFISSRTF